MACGSRKLKAELLTEVSSVPVKGFKNNIKRECSEVPVVAQWLMNPTRNHGVVSSIPGLAQ